MAEQTAAVAMREEAMDVTHDLGANACLDTYLKLLDVHFVLFIFRILNMKKIYKSSKKTVTAVNGKENILSLAYCIGQYKWIR